MSSSTAPTFAYRLVVRMLAVYRSSGRLVPVTCVRAKAASTGPAAASLQRAAALDRDRTGLRSAEIFVGCLLLIAQERAAPRGPP
ncbi:hypothetical protein WJX81_003268 [Elliptochloris bilobata]|uniref:Secreted protein n=1 Tax=Elliptochloris bilobata TaxID=381761 RepID=A0AAW1QNP1_9CHLO